MKVKTLKITKEEVIEDVTLPAYSEHHLDNSTIYAKLSENPRTRVLYYQTIQIYDRIATKIDYQGEVLPSSIHRIPDLGQNTDYYLGRGEYSSDQESWERADRRYLHGHLDCPWLLRASLVQLRRD